MKTKGIKQYCAWIVAVILLTLACPDNVSAQTYANDASFNIGTGADGRVTAIILQTDSKILIAGGFTTFNGTSRGHVARLNSDGSLDTSFDSTTGANDWIWGMALQSDGKVLIGGDFTSVNGTSRNRVARLNSDGSLDTSFDPGSGANGSINDFAIQSNNEILIGGNFSTINGTVRRKLARLNSDGSLDTSFDAGNSTDIEVWKLALQSDGKLLAAGQFTSFAGTSRNGIVRVNSDGTLDTTFDPGTGATLSGGAAVSGIAIQSDNKILIGGNFTSFNGTAAGRIARLNTDGSVDTSFDAGTGADTQVRAIAIQSDNKLVVGGFFSSFNSATHNNIVRLNSDGSLDTTFDAGAGANNSIFAAAVQSDGRILLGGDFSSLSGTSRGNIGRLKLIGNSPPTLTTVSALSGGIENTPLTINYSDITAAADEADADGNTISFRIESVSSGTLTKGGTAVTAGTTLLSSGESLVWTPALNASGTLNAFTVKAYDGTAASATDVQVQVQVTATASFPIIEDFDSESNSSLTSAGWLLSGNTTATADALRLTQALNNQSGSAVYNQAFSSGLGINVQFDYFMGGATFGAADGLSFFLLDGSVTSPTIGGLGGALGYTYNDVNTVAGVFKGYLGVGFDRFGNFLNNQYLADGLGSGLFPNYIGVRGPGTLNNSLKSNHEYKYVIGSATPFTVEGSRKVNLTVKADGTLSMQISTDGGTTWQTIYNNLNFVGSTAFSGYSTPAILKLGFAASTGGQNNEHRIDNLRVTLPADLVVAFTGTPSGHPAVGSTAIYTVTVANNGPNADPAVQFIYPVPAALTGVAWSYSISGGSGSGSGSGSGNNISTTLNLPVGSTATFTVSGTIDSSALGQTLSHTATAANSSGYGDPSLGDKSVITTTIVNSSPVLASISDRILLENSSATVSLSSTVVDGDTVTYSVSGGDPTTVLGSISGSTLTLTPAANFTTGSPISFTVTASDGHGNTDSKVFNVTEVDAATAITGSSGSVANISGRSASTVDSGLIVSGSLTLEGARVFISSNFASGDTLTFTAAHGITGSFNATTGVLTLSGTGSASDYQDVLRSVAFGTTSTSTASRTVKFTLGTAIPFRGADMFQDHYYEYVQVSSSISWTSAKADAASRTLNGANGLHGYLATITTQAENDFVQQKLAQDGWIGASDSFSEINAATGTTTYGSQVLSENHWYWVTGPEAGTHFADGSASFGGNFVNFNSGEPNNVTTFDPAGENYIEMFSAAGNPVPGRWNDLPDNGVPSLSINILGYVVEYGGSSSDSSVQISSIRTVTVALNQAPTLTSINTLSGGLEDASFPIAYSDLTAAADEADLEGDPISFRIETVSSGTLTKNGVAVTPGTTLLSNGESLVWTPAADANGTIAAFTVKAFDGELASATAMAVQVDVAGINDIPSFTKGADQSVSEDAGVQTVTGWATSINPGAANESGQTLTFVVSNDNNGIFSAQPAISSVGVLTFTPAANTYGSAIVTVLLQDDGGTANGGVDTSASQTFTITVVSVNDTPSFVKGADQTISEDSGPQTIAGWASSISVGPSDESGQTPAFVVSNNNNALFSVQPAISPAGVLTYTPAADANGSATVTVSLQDDGGTANGAVDTSAAQTFTITVASVNDVPSFTKGVDQTLFEDAGAQAVTGWATSINAGAVNESSQTLTFIVTSDNNGLFSAQPAVNSAGVLTFTPAANAHGTATVTISLKDNGGTANGGADTSASQTFTISVAAVNDAPSFAKGADQTVLENSGVQVVPGWATSISAGPSDESGQTLTFTVTNDNNALFSAQPVISLTGVLTYTPAASASGSATVTVLLKDNGGTANGGSDTSAPQTFTITVAAVNHVPSFVKGADETVLEDAGAQTVAGWATAISAGPSNESNQALAFVVSNDNNALFLAQPAISSAGILTYTPAANANGSATVTVSLKDNGGTANGGVDTSAPQTFAITVTAVNDAPSFVKGADQTVLEDAGAQTVSGWATAISAGPSDESGQTVTFAVGNDNNALFSTQPAISPTGVLTYTPAANANGIATVTVLLKDNGGTANGGVNTSASQTFTITVTTVNDVPSFVKGADQTVLEDAGAQTVAGWATSMSSGPANESSQVLSFLVNNNNNALFSAQPAISAAGVLTYTPAADANGSATVTVSLQDNGGTANGGVDTSAAQTFTITVISVNDAPTLGLISDQTVLEDSAQQNVVIGGIGTGAANENQTLTISAVSSDTTIIPNPSISYTSPGGTAVLSYQPLANANGTVTITVTISDDGGTANGGVNISSRTFNIDVTPVNDPPTLADISNPDPILEDSTQQTVTLTGITAGPSNENQSLTVTATSSDPSLIPNPTVTYTSPQGQATLSYTPVADANGTATITVTVKDNGGVANNGIDSVTKTFQVVVTPVNDPPTLQPLLNLTMVEDGNPNGIILAGITAGPANEHQNLKVFASTDNPSLFETPEIEYTSPNTTGEVTLRSRPNANGTATVTVMVLDDGGKDHGGLDFVTRTLQVTVRPVNDVPVLGTVKTLNGAVEDTPFVISYDTLLSATDAQDIDGDVLKIRVESVLAGKLEQQGTTGIPGETLLAPGGQLKWTPPENANGLLEAFTIRVWDGNLASATMATVAIAVEAVNDAPVISGLIDRTIKEDETAFARFGISDVETVSSNLVVTATSSNQDLVPDSFLLVSTGGAERQIVIMPLPDQNGSANITVKVTDDEGLSTSKTFTLTVIPVNDAPTIESVKILEGATNGLPFAISYDLFATNAVAADVDKDPISFRLEEMINGELLIDGTNAIPGKTLLSADAPWVWMPDTDGERNAFIVRAFDGELASTNAVLVKVKVEPAILPVQKLTASDGRDKDLFGYSVDIDGGVLVIGAPQSLDAGGTLCGAAYVFVRKGTNWVEQAKLTPQDGQEWDRFGSAVSISGSTIAIGAYEKSAPGSESGAAYIYVRKGTNWTQQARLTPKDSFEFDHFGSSVSIEHDTLVVGANQKLISGKENAGAAYVFVRNGTNWVQQGRLTASDAGADDWFGLSVDISGDNIVVGALLADVGGSIDAGKAYVFARNGTNWTEQARLSASDGAEADRFGSSVAIHGTTVVVGASLADLPGKPDAGAAYVYQKDSGDWKQTAKLTAVAAASGDWFGASVSVDTNRIIIGAHQATALGKQFAGAAYSFDQKEEGWAPRPRMVAKDLEVADRLGAAVSCSQGTIIGGAYLSDPQSKIDAGAAYVFVLEPPTDTTGDDSVTLESPPAGSTNNGAAAARQIHINSPLSLDSSCLVSANYVPGQGYRVLVSGPAGQHINLEASDDLLHWRVIDRTTLTLFPFEYMDQTVANSAGRYYRVVRVPDQK